MNNNTELFNKQMKSGARDKRGVRVANYNKTMKGRDGMNKEDDNGDVVNVLLDTIDKGLFDPVETESGERVERRASGMPPKYPTLESFRDKVKEYFDYIRDTYNNRGVELIPDVEGVCSFCGISRDQLRYWECEGAQDWQLFVKSLKNHIAAYKKQKGMNGKIPPIVMALDFNNNHGYVQSQKIELENRLSMQELPTLEDIKNRLPDID